MTGRFRATASYVSRLLFAASLCLAGWFGTDRPAAASHEDWGPGRYAEAQIDTTEGAPGTVIGVSGTCQWAEGVPATSVAVRLIQKAKPWRDTSKELPVAEDSTFDGELVVTVDLPPGPQYRLRTTCWADDQAYGVHDFDFEVLPGEPNPNHAAVSPTKGPPGTTIELAGVCMFTPDRPAARIDGTFRPPNNGDWTRWSTDDIAADGEFETTLTVPDDADAGEALVDMRCHADKQEYGAAEFPFVITKSAQTTTTAPPTTTTPLATPVHRPSTSSSTAQPITTPPTSNPPATPPLANTGAPTSAATTLAGVALIAAGAFLLLIARISRRANSRG